MSIFNFLKQKKFTREPREWQFFTKTTDKDYEFKTKSPYDIYDDEGQQLWNHVLLQLNRAVANNTENKEIFIEGNSRDLVIYAYRFRDGRRDNFNRKISNYLILKLTPEFAQKYMLQDFVNIVYSRKFALKNACPTGFDLADKFPVQWDDAKSMESRDENFLNAHPTAQNDDFSFEKKDFENDNKTWQTSKKENAIFLSTKFYPEKPKSK